MYRIKAKQISMPYLGNGFDFGAEFGFNFVQGESVVVGDQVDCHTEMAEPSGPTDSVQVGLRHLGEVEVDDNVDSLNVDTAGQQVGAHQVPAKTGSEVVEDAVPRKQDQNLFHTCPTVPQIKNIYLIFRNTNR